MLETTVFRSGCRVLRSLSLFLSLIALIVAARPPVHAQVSAPFAWGYNGTGELGDGTYTSKNTAVPVSKLSGVTQVTAGWFHSLALKPDGTVWAWGDNSYGQLGDGNGGGDYDENGDYFYYDSNVPVKAAGLTGVVQVAGGGYHSLALKSDGTVWAWGDNEDGELGDGTNWDSYTPVQVSELTGVVQIAGGGYHSLALKSDGTVWAWGYNNSGQLGDGTSNEDRHTPVQVLGLTGVAQVAGRGNCSFALKSDGTVWAWGDNSRGQLGDGTTTNRTTPVQVLGLTGVAQVAAGDVHSLALKSDGTVWAWGYNNSGQLGDGTNTDRNTPVQVSGLTGVTQVAGGGYHSLAVKSDGTVWAWGYNNSGQLGDGTNTNRSTPVQTLGLTKAAQVAAGGYHSLALVVLKTQNTQTLASDIKLFYGSLNLVATLKDADGKTLANKTITFTLDGNEIGKANTNATGRASLKVPNPENYNVGTHPFKADFAKETLYNASSASATLTITKADTLATPANLTVRLGETKYLTATLTYKADSSPIASQSVAFKLDGVAIGTATTDGTGTASLSFNYETLTAGAHTLSVRYAGDSNHNGSAGTGTLTVAPGETTIATESASGKVGQTVNFTATLTRNTDKAGVSGKTVVFKLAGNVAGSAVTGSDGKAVLAYKIGETIPVGSVILSAEFGGDSLYLASANVKKRSLTIAKASVKLNGDNLSGKRGSVVVLKSTLTRRTDGAVLAGRTVRFQIDGSDAGSGVTDANGVASVSYTIPTTLAVGKYAKTVIFDGDDFHLAYSASGTTLTVK